MSSIHSFGVTMPNTPYVRAKLTQLGFVSSDYSLNSRQQLYVSLIGMSFIDTNTFIRGKREITYDDLRCLLLINDLEGQFAYMRSEGLAYLVNNKLHSEIPF
jgi:hypothetical protein